MRFQFDPNQDYQLQAIEAVADLFTGQPRLSGGLQFTLGAQSALAAVPNRLDLEESTILANLRTVQGRNRIAPDGELRLIEETIDSAAGPKPARFGNFSVEMETGTGKTYVYLRTMLELNRRYGMRKFIVVVPSVAIREGVLKTLQVTQDHLRALYDNVVYRYYVYDSANLSQVRNFAISDSVEVMVMTIDSFNKSANVLRQSAPDRFEGTPPVQLIQACRPVLILDEPQNMESEKRVAALALLDPLFALRYSATHRNPYNVVYRLTPGQAYQQGLVKKIEVDSVVRSSDENRPYIRLEAIETRKLRVSAKLRVHKLMKSGAVSETSVTVRLGDSLAAKTGRKDYAGYEVDEINPGGGFVRFANEVELRTGQEVGADKEAVFDVQIRHTIEKHLERQAYLRSKGIKVLSLFFIDRVGNYAAEDGLIRRLFRAAFDEIKQKYTAWRDVDAEAVQAAYFAQKRRKTGAVELLDSSEGGDKKEDQAAYDLIMRDKESLLSFPGPEDDAATRRMKQVAFIFSHSALREGWDNPNVFQICTLNQTASITKKRQEVGRGVRLAVDQTGQRVHDEQINVLTVVANESYREYVESYQGEIAFEYRSEIEARYGKPIGELTDAERRKIEEEYGEGILPPPPRKAQRRKARLRKARVLSDEFKKLWERIKHKTLYAVTFDEEKLLSEVVPEIERTPIARPRITITKAAMIVGDTGMFEAMQVSSAKTARDLVGRYPMPDLVDLMAHLMEHTTPPVFVTRGTLLRLYARLGNKQAAAENPHEWASTAVRILKERLADVLVDGIQYSRVADLPGAGVLPEDSKWYRMSQVLDETEVELFSKFLVRSGRDTRKAIYDLIPCDSEIERQFVKGLEARRDVKLYVKLPYWFTVPTPVGEYHPDWAIVMQDDEAEGKPVLYLVSETKSTTRLDELRSEERRKVKCGAAHFGSRQFGRTGALQDVDYLVVTSADDLP